MIAPVIVGAIVAAISAIVTATSAAIKAAPTKGDKYRKNRIKQLDVLAREGFTAAQEDELRAIGLGAAATAERESRSRMGDALASLAGGATANDILGANARQRRDATEQRRLVENEVTRADMREAEIRRAELNSLIAQQENSGRAKRNVVAQGIETLGSAASNLVATTALSNMEEGKGTIEDAATRTYGPQASSQSSQNTTISIPDQSQDVFTVAPDQGTGMEDLKTMVASMTPAQRKELEAMFGSLA